MKQFFKYVLATVVGILCIGVLWSMMAFVMLGVRHFRTAAKMFISSALAVFLTIALLVTTGPLLFVFGVETAEIEESASR